MVAKTGFLAEESGVLTEIKGDDVLKQFKKRYFKQVASKTEDWASLSKLYYFKDDKSGSFSIEILCIIFPVSCNSSDNPGDSLGFIDLTNISSVSVNSKDSSQFQLLTSGRLYVLQVAVDKGLFPRLEN